MEQDVTIILNGTKKTTGTGTTIESLLSERRIVPASVVVERNERIVEKGTYGSTVLTDGDRVEILHFVGGG